MHLSQLDMRFQIFLRARGVSSFFKEVESYLWNVKKAGEESVNRNCLWGVGFQMEFILNTLCYSNECIRDCFSSFLEAFKKVVEFWHLNLLFSLNIRSQKHLRICESYVWVCNSLLRLPVLLALNCSVPPHGSVLWWPKSRTENLMSISDSLAEWLRVLRKLPRSWL